MSPMLALLGGLATAFAGDVWSSGSVIADVGIQRTVVPLARQLDLAGNLGVRLSPHWVVRLGVTQAARYRPGIEDLLAVSAQRNGFAEGTVDEIAMSCTLLGELTVFRGRASLVRLGLDVDGFVALGVAAHDRRRNLVGLEAGVQADRLLEFGQERALVWGPRLETGLHLYPVSWLGVGFGLHAGGRVDEPFILDPATGVTETQWFWDRGATLRLRLVVATRKTTR